MRVIGIIGKSRSGKTTAAYYLDEQYGMVQFALATPVKDMLKLVFGDVFYNGDRKQVIPWVGHSPRKLMQSLGTDWGREMLGEDIWIKVLEREIKKTPGVSQRGIVITDVRFRNEAQWVLEKGGVLIRLVRDDIAPPEEVSPGAALAGLMDSRSEYPEAEQEDTKEHASETETWEGVPHICLENNGDLNELYSLLDEVMSGLLEEGVCSASS